MPIEERPRPWTSTSGNWICVGAAYLVFLCYVEAESSPNPGVALAMIEALPMLLPALLPALILQQWKKQPRVYHVWTLVLSIVLAGGGCYSRTHPH